MKSPCKLDRDIQNSDVSTTEIYARADETMKRKALLEAYNKACKFTSYSGNRYIFLLPVADHLVVLAP